MDQLREPTPELIGAPIEVVGPKVIVEARGLGHKLTSTSRPCCAQNRHALHEVWYAASLMALYYLHYDDMRFGYLWAEYKAKMRFEVRDED